MYIKPIEKFSSTDIVTANRFRRIEVQKVLENKELIDNLFLKLRNSLNSNNKNEIKEILSYKLFFEIIPAECIADLSSMYLTLDIEGKSRFIQLLKDSYIRKGNRGFVFSFMPVISRKLI